MPAPGRAAPGARLGGNITVNPRVGLLFIDWERPRRLRVSGEASLVEPDAIETAKELLAKGGVDKYLGSPDPRHLPMRAVVSAREMAQKPTPNIRSRGLGMSTRWMTRDRCSSCQSRLSGSASAWNAVV